MRAGFGKSELTPPLGIELTGYGYYLNRRAESICDPLFARALLLENAETKSLIISCELLGLNRAICADVKAHASEMGIDHVLMVSVHTHTGPSTKYHEGCGYPDEAYVATVAGKINQAIDLAYTDLSPVTSLSHMCAPLPGDYIYNRTCEDGPVDRTVRGFCMERENKPAVAAVNIACHCVFRGRSTAVSADFAGAVNRIMEDKGYESMFLNGVCGDIDPWQATDERLNACAALVADIFCQNHQILPLTLEAGALPFTLQLMPVTAEDICAAAENAVILRGGPEEPASRVALIWKDEMLAKLDTIRTEEPINVQYVVLGGLPVVALPFETFTRTGQLIREELGREDALVLGCAEELLGYLPTRDDIKRGSYAALESTFLYKRLPPVPGEAERLGEEMGKALSGVLA